MRLLNSGSSAGAADLLYFQRSQLVQGRDYRCRVDQNRRGPLPRPPADCVAQSGPREVGSHRPGAASTAGRGKPCRTRLHWPASTATLHILSPTAFFGSYRDVRQGTGARKEMSSERNDSATIAFARPAYAVSLPETNLERKQILCLLLFSRSLAATPAELPPPDWRPPAITAPDALATPARVRRP